MNVLLDIGSPPVTWEKAQELASECYTDLLRHKVLVQQYCIVGSTYILGEGADVDVLVLAPSQYIPFDLMGYKPSTQQHYIDARFESYRKGDINLLVTTSEEYFEAWRWAAEVCKRFKVQDKNVRIAVHACIKSLSGFEC